MSTSTDKLLFIEDKALLQYRELYTLYQSNPQEPVTLKSALENASVTLTPNALKLALLFVNGLKVDKQGKVLALEHNRNALETFYKGSRRYQEIQAYFDKNAFWTEESRAVLVYLFGPTRAPFVEGAWHKIRHLAYQKGYMRRAFRAPNTKAVYQINQLNLVVLLNGELCNPVSMKESIQRDWERYSYGAANISLVWAAAIEAGEEDVYNTLLDIVYQRQEKGQVTSTIIKSLLLADKETAWKAVKDLLLSAQRQEGLRQTIVECLDEGILESFLYFIEVILEQKLLRFSSVVRALDVWVGLGWEAAKKSTAKRFLELGYEYLKQPEGIRQAIESKDNGVVYMALWAQGVLDINACVPLVRALYEKGNVEKRCLALYFAAQGDNEFTAHHIWEEALQDDSPKVFAWGVRSAAIGAAFLKKKSQAERRALFQYLTERLETIPKEPKVYQGFAFDWISVSISKNEVCKLLINLTNFKKEEEVQALYPYLLTMDAYTRQTVAEQILPAFRPYSSYSEADKKKPLALWQRQFALDHLKDRSSAIQKMTITALSYADLSDEEIQQLEALLQRKGAGLRRSTLEVLLQQETTQIQRSTTRLLSAKSLEQRLGGLDILQQVQTKEAFKDWVVTQTLAYQERPKHSKREALLLEGLTAILGDQDQEQYTWENGLGLYDPNNQSPAVKPKPPTGVYLDVVKENRYGFSHPWKTIQKKLDDLLALLEQQANYSYEIIDWNGATQSRILGEGFYPFRPVTKENPLEGPTLYNYPLSETWLKWYEASELTARDLYLILFYNSAHYNYGAYNYKILTAIGQQFNQHLPDFSTKDIPHIWNQARFSIIRMLSEIDTYPDKTAFVEGLVRRFINSLSEEQLSWVKKEDYYGSNYYYSWHNVHQFSQINNQYSYTQEGLSDQEFEVYWEIQHWVSSSNPDKERGVLPIDVDVRAFLLKRLTEDELYHRLLRSDVIRQLTYRDTGKEKDKPYLLIHQPFLEPLIARCKARILEIELQRGDSPTIVSDLATQIQALYGVDYFVKILQALGKEKLHRGYSWGERGKNKKELLSTLLSRLYPNKEDAASFKEKIKAAEITDKRLVEAALYAPQWLELVADYLGWKGFVAAAWWLQAHTKSYNNDEADTKIAHYSKVELAEFDQGAVDIQWFKTAYKTLGKARWKILYEAAKYLSTGGQHKRAQLFADVILGNTKITAVNKRIKASRNQDYLRAYGLVPLSRKTPEKDLLKRYQFIQKFKKESKQFGSQKQSSEASAVTIALENLARTAGYDDPLRLTWAMESKTVQQILATAKPIALEETVITLHIDPQGKAQLRVEKAGKPLANVPAKHRKNAQVLAMRQDVKMLREQLRRTRRSLEQAMVNGDSFRYEELQDLLEHPVVAPLVRQLVFESEGKLGFLHPEGLLNAKGVVEPLGTQARLAHCYDLYAAGEWSTYQQSCFEQKIKQPFKQIFRTLYLPTPDEVVERVRSRRYAGHQVQPKKTIALLKSRGWTVDYYEGLQKVFHKEQLVAQAFATADWFSPADVESPTLETIEVRDLKTHQLKPLDELNPCLFSELMRDMDLVVSVAHVGGVDPEASLSTIEMRAVLVEETARLFKLGNVSISKRHAHVKGTLGDYTVHLGSGVCHQLPGNYLSILAVPSQHRGRIFLPFVDDDPRTAEVLSKILMLSKDDKIQDPTILRQLDQRLVKKG
ncbi:MAG: DUF4132 domain-containing protein [Aureispira sp.]